MKWSERVPPEKRRQYRQTYRAKHRDKVNEKRRERYATDEGVRERRLATNYRWERANRDKRRAQVALGRAVRAGKIAKAEACELCGGNPVEAHHDDYSKPLQVQWLCRFCHRKVERGSA